MNEKDKAEIEKMALEKAMSMAALCKLLMGLIAVALVVCITILVLHFEAPLLALWYALPAFLALQIL